MVDLFVVRKGGIGTAVNDAIAAQKNAANGIAPLDAASKVPAANSRVESVATRTGAITLGVADVSGALNKAGDTMTGALVLAADPVSALQPVTKQMLDALLSGLDAKPDVRAASTTNVVIATGGLLTVDGVTLVAGNRVLLKDQTTGSENGIYVASAGAWTRATDADTAVKIKDMYTFVAEGAVGGNRDTGWMLTTDAITLGTTALVYGQFSGPGSTLAGTGLTRSGNTISASFGSAANTIAQGNDARLRTIRDEGVNVANRAILDFLGTGVIVEDDSVSGRTKVTISGAAAGAASETAAGITEQATQAEVEAGTAGNLFATVARLKVELDRRGPMDAFVELLRNNTVGGQAITSGGSAPVGWGFEVMDGRNWHSTATNPERITPDAPGYYAGMVYTIWDSNTVTGRREMLVRKWSGGVDTVIARDIILSGSGAQYNSLSPMSLPFASYVAQGEYFEVLVFQNSGAGLNLDNTSRFSLARVR